MQEHGESGLYLCGKPLPVSKVKPANPGPYDAYQELTSLCL